MEEGLTAEHGGELFRDPLEEVLDCGAVPNERARHLQAPRGDIAHCSFHIVRDPLHEVVAVLVLHIQHLLVNLLHGHATTEDGGYSQVASVAGVAGGHHVLGVKHLLSQLWDCEGAVLLAATGRERGKTRHEEMQTREWHHVNSKFTEVSVQLPWEPQTRGHTRHGRGDKVV